MTNYEKGVRYEYEFKKLLEDNGYEVTRASASHSPFDIIAVKYTPENKKICFIALVQCKVRKLKQNE